jgi:hypothetical protein
VGNCLQLAIDNPDLAIDNADNYRLFTRDAAR